MSAPRLLFLYPSLLRVSCPRHLQPSTVLCSSPRRLKQRANFSAVAKKHQQEAFAQRYGSAQEPQMPPPDGLSKQEELEPSAPSPDASAPPATPDSTVEAPTTEQNETLMENESQAEDEKDIETDKEPLSPQEDRGKAIEFAAQDPAERVRQLNISSPTNTLGPPSEDTSDASSASDPSDSQQAQTREPTPLSAVLAMPAPSIESPTSDQKPPHLQAPPYIHHFDTYTLVQRLHAGAFTPKQSEAIMKSTRSLLSQNLSLAQDSLVSKSDVENETYLFRAACSELRTEILNLRRSTTSKQKSQLSHLQHTFDILSQRTTAELASLRDELKGMLNERRMDNRQNSQGLDGRIAELNYKIGVRFAGEAKSGVEGLRWVMTRRSAMAFAGMVGMILGALWYGSLLVHERERRVAERKNGVGEGGAGAAAAFVGASQGTQTEGPEQQVGGGLGKGDLADVGYTSLG